jgi:hypothetical protein
MPLPFSVLSGWSILYPDHHLEVKVAEVRRQFLGTMHGVESQQVPQRNVALSSHAPIQNQFHLFTKSGAESGCLGMQNSLQA